MRTARKQLWNSAVVLVVLSLLFSATFVFSVSPVLAQKDPPTDPQTGELPLDDPSDAEVGQAAPETGQLLSAAAQNGQTRIIVVLNAAEGAGSGEPAAVYASAQDALAQSMAGFRLENVYRYRNFPLMAMQVDSSALQALLKNPLVAAVQEDSVNFPTLAESSAIVGSVEAALAGYTGSGMTLAVIDTGVDKGHTFLAGRVVEEACFSTGNGIANSLCPNGQAEQYGAGAGAACNFAYDDGCKHGTHVAGIAAGKGNAFSGIARDANIIAINVFSDYLYNGAHYLSTFDSDYIKALDFVYTLRNSYAISSVNMSLGGSIRYPGYCDAAKPAVKKAVDRLRGANIATVIAAGNSGWDNGLASPACVSSAVSVGSTNKDDTVSDFSNSAGYLSLLAPGGQINSSIPGGGFEILDGTSMAAPHVAGAWAVLRQAFPTKSVSSILALLKSTGVPVKDTRNGKVKARINIAYALGKFQKPQIQPTLLQPINGAEVASSTPALSWGKVPLVSKYKVVVKRSGTATVFSKLLPASTVCPATGDTCSTVVTTILKPGLHTWTVQPFSGAGGGPASAPASFNAPSVPPAAVNLTYPVSGIGFYSPPFQWEETAAPAAAKYTLRVYFNGKRLLNRTYDALKICDSGACSVPHPLNLKEGDYTWEVLPWNPAGYGPVSTAGFDYHAVNGFENSFDLDSTGITMMYPLPSWWWVENSYLFTEYGKNYTFASARVDATYGDVDLTAVMYRDGDQVSSNGIVLRGVPVLTTSSRSWKSGYFFLYANDGSYSVWKVYNSGAYPIQDWTFSNAVAQNGTNTLRAYAIGTDLGLYINGTLVWTGSDTAYGPAFTGGSAGITSFVPNWYLNHDFLAVDRITVAPNAGLTALGGDTVSAEQQSLNEAARAGSKGSIYGSGLTAAEVNFLQSAPDLGEATPEQKREACLAAGDPCTLGFPR